MESNNQAKRVMVRRPLMHNINWVEWMKGSKRGEHSEDSNDEQSIELPRDVTDMIMATLVKHFCMRDAIRCSMVCKRWINIARLEAPVEPPWITVVDMLSGNDQYSDCFSLWGKEGSLDQSIYRLSGAPTTICKLMRSNPPSFLKLRSDLLASSQGGWLLRGCRCYHSFYRSSDQTSLSDSNVHPISLYNPFTKICFDLPNYKKPVETCCRLRGITDISECSVFTHNLYPGYYFVVLSSFGNLSLCRVDGEGNWFHFHNRRHFRYQSVLFRMEEQCLYALDDEAGLDIFTIECHNKNGNQEFHLRPLYFVQVASFSGASANQFKTTNLVEFRGHIIVVICVDNTVELYKLDNKDKLCLSRVHSIGDEAFFMGFWGGPFCVSATSFSKVQQNCIYYHKFLQSAAGYSCTIISLEDGSTKYLDVGRRDGYSPLGDSKLIAPPPLSSYQHDEF